MRRGHRFLPFARIGQEVSEFFVHLDVIQIPDIAMARTHYRLSKCSTVEAMQGPTASRFEIPVIRSSLRHNSD